MEKKINIAIVDDDKLVVQLLSEFLQQQNFINHIISANSGNSFVQQLESVEELPDIVLMDLRMKNGDGISTIDILSEKYPTLKIIVLSSYYKSVFTGYMLKTGVSAFIPKETDKEDLIYIIKEVQHKGHYFSPDQIEKLRTQITDKTPKLHTHSKESLTQREKEVLEFICKQYTAKQIAEKMFVTTKTIEAHKSNIFLKTGVKNTVGLIFYAIQNNFINPEEIVLLE